MAGSAQKWVVGALFPNRGGFAMPWVNRGIVRKDQQFLVNGFYDLRKRPARQVSPPYAALKERVPGNEPLRAWRLCAGAGTLFGMRMGVRDCLPRAVGFHHQADAAGSVSGGVENSDRKSGPSQRLALPEEIINLTDLWRRNAQPLRLRSKGTVRGKVGFVNQNGCFGGAAQRGERSHVIDVRVGAEDGAYMKSVALDHIQYPLRLLTRINDDCLARLRVAQNRAIALQHSNRNDFVNKAIPHHAKV